MELVNQDEIQLGEKMQFENLTLYPNYDLYTPDIIERSTLYFLEPINVGTIECESLISYLIRLAEVPQRYSG